jgi:hypothetical protein
MSVAVGAYALVLLLWERVLYPADFQRVRAMLVRLPAVR